MIDTQHKVSCHFRFIEQLICPDLFVQTALSTTGKVTAKLKEIEQTFCTPFNRQRTPVCNHVPFTTRHQFNGHCPTSLPECSLSLAPRDNLSFLKHERVLWEGGWSLSTLTLNLCRRTRSLKPYPNKRRSVKHRRENGQQIM